MRHVRTRCLTAVVLAALTAGGLAACSDLRQQSFEDDAKVSQKVTSIRLDDRNGKVEVDASHGAATTVHRKISYHDDKPGATFHVKDGVLTLFGCGRNCSADYIVHVPAGLPVTGGTSNAALVLNDVGTVDVHTSNGRIAVTGAAGAVKLRTSNAAVYVKDAKGAIDAQTSNGKMTIRSATPQDIRAHTSDAALTLTAPPAKYRITAHTTNGDRKVAFANVPSGTYRLDLSTSNADLTVQRAG